MPKQYREIAAERQGKTELICVRTLSKDNIDDVWRLEQICFPEDPWSKNMFESELDNPLSVFLAAYDEESNELAAYGGVWLMYDIGNITNIAVNPSYRGEGIGRELLRLLEKLCRERGMNEITLEVREKNEPAKNLYLSEGYEECGLRKGYYRDRESAVIMTKKLKG